MYAHELFWLKKGRHIMNKLLENLLVMIHPSFFFNLISGMIKGISIL